MNTQFGIALGLVLGLAFGIVAAVTGSPALAAGARAIAPVGTAFVQLVRMVVVPLVAATVFTGVARLGDPRRLGRLGAITLAFFWSTTLVAIAVGMTVMRLALPFAPATVAPAGDAPAVERLPGIVDFLVGLVPVNPIDAAAKGAMLPLIVFVVFFAAAASSLAPEARERLIGLADAIALSMVKLVHWILRVAPVGVFALAASTAALAGWSMLQNLALFVAAVLAGLVAFFLLVYLSAVRAIGGVSPVRFVRACVAPVALAMATTSSAAALPALFESADSLGLSRPVSSFVLSLGSAINRTGSALFQGAAIVFLASLYHVTFTPASVTAAILTTFLMSQTVAGVPSAGIMTLAPALGALGIPLSGLTLLFGVDRIPDMVRTATQVTGHLATAVVVERYAGARGLTAEPRTNAEEGGYPRIDP
ncbi:MAG: dicarboxylate/amino acid:cation symporter [Gemmatimonadales bacterium]